MKRREFIQKTAGIAAAAAGLRARADAATATAPPPVNAAIIGQIPDGLNAYGHKLDLIFAGRPGVEVVAVADPNAEHRAAAQQRTGARRAYADYREMLERERPQLVSVAVLASVHHYAIVKAALAAGAHVLCEKPMTRSLAEADELLALADRSGRKLAFAHQLRLYPATLHLKRRLDDGLIGELLEIRMHGKQDQRAGGEDLVVLGTHLCDLARFFAGEPEWCSARVLQGGREIVAADAHSVSPDIGPIAGDEITAMVAFPHGVNVHYTSREKNAVAAGLWGMEFIGSRGAARLSFYMSPQLSLRHDGAWRPLENDPTATTSTADRLAGNRVLVDDWLAAIAENREPVCNGFAAMKALEMIHAIFTAGLSRGRVELPLKNRQHPLAS
ncbi:MAG: Gfo/Idh/MocA family protein [Opitutaceae bacterium]